MALSISVSFYLFSLLVVSIFHCFKCTYQIMWTLRATQMIRLFLFYFCFLCVASENSDENEEFCTINTNSGQIRGKQNRTLFDNKTYYSFRGIPFAKPPIGDLRFKVTKTKLTKINCNKINKISFRPHKKLSHGIIY